MQPFQSTIGLMSPPDSATGGSPQGPPKARETVPLANEESATQEPLAEHDAEIDAEPQPKKGEVGNYLENLSHMILDVSLNQKNNAHPLVVKHMSPIFRGKHDALPKVNNRGDHQDSLKKHLEKQPELNVSIHNSSSDVDESRGRATVYIWYSLGGLEHGLAREAVAILSWEKKQGTWMIVKHSGMRGPSGFS